jgi:MFS family permease
MRRTVVMVCAVVSYESMFFTVLAPLLPHLADRYDLSVAGAGILNGAYAAGAFAAAIPSGLLASRIGVKATTLGGLVLLATASLGFALAADVELLFVARLAQGCGCALAWTGGLAWLVGQVPRERRGETIGIALGAALVGALVGPALGALAELVGTRPVFVGLAVPGLALAAWGLTIADGPPQTISLATFRRAFKAPSVYRPALLVLLGGYLLGVISVLVPLRLAGLHWSASAIAALFLFSAGAQALLNPLLGRWSDRRGVHLPLELGLVLSAIGSVALAVESGRWSYGAIAFWANVAFGLIVTPGIAMLSDSTTALRLEFAAGFAIMNLAWPPGQLIGSALGGVIAGATSDSVVWLITGGLCVAGLAAVAFPRRSPTVVDTPSPLH